MSRLHTLHAAPAAGFDQPFELLAACHARMVRSLALLGRLAAHLRDKGCDAQARDAAADIQRYFDVAAPLHHEDEELHVLPRLRAQGRGDLADRILAEHRTMEQAWAEVREDLQAVQSGTLSRAQLDTADGAQARWSAFTALYQRHMQAEDGEAYPAAEAGLSAHDAQAMGDDMARRRGAPRPAR